MARVAWIAASVAIAATAAAPAVARSTSIDLPPGSVSDQVLALGRIARISIAVSDPRLWSRRLPALRGRMTAVAALRTIAMRSGGRVVTLGPGLYRLEAAPAPPPARPRPIHRPAPPPPPEKPAADIVVTASKRDLSLDHIAGQVVRVSGEDLQLGGVGGTERLSSRSTTIASTFLGAGRNKLFIRGIADSSFTGPTQATVGQYFGDLRLSYNAPDPDLRLADLQAVEVLAGPQGTLYGAGSLGGLIRLVPNPVDLTRSAGSATVGASATAHGAPGMDAQTVVNVPIIPGRLGVRFVATAADEGGYIDKPSLGRRDVNRTRIIGGRGTVHLELSDAWNVDLIGIAQRIRGADSQYADRDAAPLTRAAPVVEGFDADFRQGQMVLNGRIGRVHVRSSTGLTAHDLMERYDATPPGGLPTLFTQANRTRMFANETRAWRSARDGSGWLAGLSFTNNRTALRRTYGAPLDRIPLAGVSNGVTETTAYGEGSFRPFRPVLLTGGLRVTRSILTGSAEDTGLQSSPVALAIVAKRRTTNLLPSLSALVDLTSQSSVFLRYQQGFRPGGLAIDGDYVSRFDSDRVATIEAGYRFGRTPLDPFAFTLTVAHTEWRDIQADFLDAGGFPTTANVGNGDLWTVETTASMRVSRDLRLDGAISLTDSNIDERDLEVLGLTRTSHEEPLLASRLRPIPNIAAVTARAGIVYDAALTDLTRLRLDGWVRYVGPSRLGIGPVLGDDQGSYVDSGVTARLGWDRIGISLGVTNLADAKGNRFSLGTPFDTGRQQITPLRPRTLRFGVDVAF